MLKCEWCKVKGGSLLVKLDFSFDVFGVFFLNRFIFAFSCYSSLLHCSFFLCFRIFPLLVCLFGVFLFCMFF